MNIAALLESGRVGVDALRANPLRTILSTTGVVIGVAALVAAFAITDGVEVWSRELILRESSVQDITISSLTTQTIAGRARPLRGYPVLTVDDARAAAREVPGVARNALTISGTTQMDFEDRRASVLLTLTTGNFDEFAVLPVEAGRFYSEAEVAHASPVVVLNHRLAEELAGSRDPIWMVGRTVKIGNDRRTVLGVLAPPKVPADEFVAFAPIRGATSLIGAGQRLLPTLRLKARSIEAVDTLRDATVDWLASRFGRAVEKLRVGGANQQLANTRQAMRLTKLLLGMLVSLILAVGGIGIMNVLLAAVSERTREIGIRKAVGARAADIHTQFLMESVTVTGVGASLGSVLGLIIAFAGTALFRHWLGSDIHPVLRAPTAVFAVASAVLVGLVFGTYPARRAARLAPIDAIAHE